MVPPTLEELVYSAAQRALDQQSTALSDLRTRTNTLVAAATLSASFLGAAAISHGAPAWAVVVAMAAFLLTGVFAGWVLWPARVSFAVDIDRMYDELAPSRGDPAVYLIEAARGLRNVYLTRTRRRSNGGRLSSGLPWSLWGRRRCCGRSRLR